MFSKPRKTCSLNTTQDPRILVVECTYITLAPAINFLIQLIESKGLSQDRFILNLKGVSLLIFHKAFRKAYREWGFSSDKHILDEQFLVQAENGKIVFSKIHDSKIYKAGKVIPG